MLEAHALDALDIEATKALIEQDRQSQIVINVGSAFLNMSVLSACIDTGVAYIDTAIHEDPPKICETPPWYANYEWKRREECEEDGHHRHSRRRLRSRASSTPMPRWRSDEYFDRIDSIDIIDINAGSHGRYFATNFDPEINFREFTGQVWSWQDSKWTSNKMFEVEQGLTTCRWSASRRPI